MVQTVSFLKMCNMHLRLEKENLQDFAQQLKQFETEFNCQITTDVITK